MSWIDATLKPPPVLCKIAGDARHVYHFFAAPINCFAVSVICCAVPIIRCAISIKSWTTHHLIYHVVGHSYHHVHIAHRNVTSKVAETKG